MREKPLCKSGLQAASAQLLQWSAWRDEGDAYGMSGEDSSQQFPLIIVVLNRLNRQKAGSQIKNIFKEERYEK